MSKYEAIIGLEIHLQLKTQSKMFCSCPNREGDKPNTNVCPICLGHPGTLPTVNQAAVEQGLLMALALDCKINKKSKFDRKNYFYPDLPKGYQISQFDEPIAEHGKLIIELEDKRKRIGITRLHLEEDAAKNMHLAEQTLVDFNRGGAPLAEIVTEPDFRSPQEAKEFLTQLRLIARYLGVSDADMEKGQLRCDANISLRPKKDKKLYAKTEVKNLNSFRSVERALQYEIERQTELWDKKQVSKLTETRGWDEAKQVTVLQRTKEGSSDYRYFPEPDLPPLVISQAMMDELVAKLVELPAAKQERFRQEYGLRALDAKVLVSQKDWAAWYESVMSELQIWVCQWQKVAIESKEATKLWEEHKAELSRLSYAWITSELFKLLPTGFKLKNLKIQPVQMAEFISLIYLKKINSTAGQQILAEMFKGKEQDPSHLADSMDLTQIDDDTTLGDLVMKVILMYPEQAQEYRNGKEPLLKFFLGQVMKESKGKANPQKIEEILKEKLK